MFSYVEVHVACGAFRFLTDTDPGDQLREAQATSTSSTMNHHEKALMSLLCHKSYSYLVIEQTQHISIPSWERRVKSPTLAHACLTPFHAHAMSYRNVIWIQRFRLWL